MSKGKDNPFAGMALVSGITSNLAGGTLIGVYVGKWLDYLFETKPFFLIAGLLLGVGAGTYGTIYFIRKHTGEE